MKAITLQNVSKRYRMFSGTLNRLQETASFGLLKRGHDFWALKNVSFEVEKGTSLGILGRNGAGKSTMLQLVAGVLQPTEGSVTTRGRISALLQLGAGFNPEFTGRENAFMNGLLLGIERREMISRFDEIEEFADLGEFMDQPVKNYSSGMKARLGFAVAVNVDPEILLVDEALSVGDGVFRHLGIRKMQSLMESGATVVFVSHSTATVKSVCEEAILLHRGRMLAHGATSEVSDRYQALLASIAAKSELKLPDDKDPNEAEAVFGEGTNLSRGATRLRYGTGEARVQNVEVLDERGILVESVSPESEVTLRIHIRYEKDVKRSAATFALRNATGLDVFSSSTQAEGMALGPRRAGERVAVDFTFRPTVHAGKYSVAAGVSPGPMNQHFDWIDVTAAFEVERPAGRGPFHGLAHLPTEVRLHERDALNLRSQKQLP